MKVAIFSGRFDPLHIGHILTIIEIAKKYDHVFVPILNYSNRFIEVEIILKIFKRIFEHMDNLFFKVTLIVNEIHFGKITSKEYKTLIKSINCENDDVTYLSGNFEVLDHMNKIGIKNRYFKRTMDEVYTGTNIRNQIKDGVCEEFL